MSTQNQTFPDNPQIQVIKSGKTGLFTNYIFKAIPLAFDESLSYYECLCGLLDYLKNTIIPTVNNNADAVAELQSLYEELRTYVNDYFTNLDVQEEINNKLDAMVEDGDLENILIPYVRPILDNQNAIIAQQNININNIDLKVQNAISGSPAGVYATVADLESADPDHLRIYVVSATGYWYYYDNANSEWAAGGLYQAVEIPDKSIDYEKLYFATHGNQLYDYQKANIRGYYGNDELFHSNANMSGIYILAEDMENIIVNQNAYIAFLDSGKSVISVNSPLQGNTSAEVPEGCYYIYISVATSSAQNLMVNEGTTILPYESFKRILNAYITKYDNDFANYNNIFYSKLTDKTNVKPEICNFITTGNQLISPYDKKENVVYNYQYGIEVSDNSYNSYRILVEPSTYYNLNNSVAHICLFDKYDNFITGYLLNANVGTNLSFETTANTAYVILSIAKTRLSTSMFSKGNTPLTYEDYSLTIPALNLDFIEKRPYQSGWITFNVPVNQVLENINNSTTTNIQNVGCVLKLPNTYSPVGKPTKLLMVCHGAGQGVVGDTYNWTLNDNYNTLINKFIENGYAVFDCNGINNSIYNSWGSPIAIQTYRKAYDYMIKNYNVEENFSVYGFSMGGLVALNMILNNMPNIKCVALGSPALDLELAWSTTVAGYFSNSETTYSKTLVAGYNPIDSIININSTDYIMKSVPPIKIWYGSTEEGVNPVIYKSLGEQFINAIKNSNGVGYYEEISGAGHEICYGGNSTANTEYVNWINRFNN